MRRRTPTIATKLTAIDHIQFDQFCRMEGKTKTEAAREAILYYMKAKEAEQINEHQSDTVVRLEKLENRLAGLLVKLGVGIYSIQHLLWTRTDEHSRQQLFSECYFNGVKMMRAKLRPDEEDLRRAA